MKKTFLIAAAFILLTAFGEPVKKYVVTWVVQKTAYAPCPEAGKTDAFGRVLPNNCTRVHFCKQNDTIRMTFFDADSARALHVLAFNQIGVVSADTTMGMIVHARLDTITMPQDSIINNQE